MQMDFWQFSSNADKCVLPGKLSEINLHAWLFSNPWGKVLIIVGISCSPDLRVQHIWVRGFATSPSSGSCQGLTSFVYYMSKLEAHQEVTTVAKHVSLRDFVNTFFFFYQSGLLFRAKTLHLHFFFILFFRIFWYWCYYPYKSKVLVSPVCRIFFEP